MEWTSQQPVMPDANEHQPDQTFMPYQTEYPQQQLYVPETAGYEAHQSFIPDAGPYQSQTSFMLDPSDYSQQLAPVTFDNVLQHSSYYGAFDANGYPLHDFQAPDDPSQQLMMELNNTYVEPEPFTNLVQHEPSESTQQTSFENDNNQIEDDGTGRAEPQKPQLDEMEINHNADQVQASGRLSVEPDNRSDNGSDDVSSELDSDNEETDDHNEEEPMMTEEAEDNDDATEVDDDESADEIEPLKRNPADPTTWETYPLVIMPPTKHGKKLHSAAQKVVPYQIPEHRYWVAIANHTVKEEGSKKERDFFWLKAHRYTTVETIWENYNMVTALENFRLEAIGGWPHFSETIEELDIFGDKLIVFRAMTLRRVKPIKYITLD